jgi:hypothetical protein
VEQTQVTAVATQQVETQPQILVAVAVALVVSTTVVTVLQVA